MERTRLPLVGLFEWAAAAACVLAVLVAAAAVSREFRHVQPMVSVNAEGASAPMVPANLRPGAIAVSELVLPDGKRLRVGEPAAALDLLGPRAQSAPTATERDDAGQRESRTYRYAGMEFVVVTRNDAIIAIYR